MCKFCEYSCKCFECISLYSLVVTIVLIVSLMCFVCLSFVGTHCGKCCERAMVVCVKNKHMDASCSVEVATYFLNNSPKQTHASLQI